MNKQKYEEELVKSYDTVLLAKKKGFDVPVIYGVYGKKMKLTADMGSAYNPSLKRRNWNGIKSRASSVPTVFTLQKWLSEKHLLHVNAFPLSTESWYYSIRKYYPYEEEMMFESIVGSPFDPAVRSDSFVEALEKGIVVALNKI